MKPKLPKTWFVDFDGTIAVHRGGELNGKDEPLPTTSKFFELIGKEDKVIIVTARNSVDEKNIWDFMKAHNYPCHQVICGLSSGARILINDEKPSGYITAYAISTKRDSGIPIGKITSVIEETCDQYS